MWREQPCLSCTEQSETLALFSHLQLCGLYIQYAMCGVITSQNLACSNVSRCKGERQSYLNILYIEPCPVQTVIFLQVESNSGGDRTVGLPSLLVETTCFKKILKTPTFFLCLCECTLRFHSFSFFLGPKSKEWHESSHRSGEKYFQCCKSCAWPSPRTVAHVMWFSVWGPAGGNENSLHGWPYVYDFYVIGFWPLFWLR